MLYAHLQQGSLNGDLMASEAPVKAGDFLGLAGNSGNSSGPHLHIHAIKGTSPWQGPPQPITFRDSWVIDRAAVSGYSVEGPWVKMKGQCLPDVTSLIWPNALLPLGWRVDLSSYRAIDPLALILSGELYVKLTLPDPPPIEVIRAYVQSDGTHGFSVGKAAGQLIARVSCEPTSTRSSRSLGAPSLEIQKELDAKIPHD